MVLDIRLLQKKLIIWFVMCFLSLQTLTTYASAQMEYAFLGAACFFWIFIWFLIAILIAIWVYKDAEKRGSSGPLWLIIVIITGIFGIIIWLIVRPPIGGKKEGTPDRRCPGCGRVIPMDARICPYCGKKFEEN